jgi:hypothetical protein
MMEHRDEPQVAKLFELGFGKRPAEELYDLRKDPGELNNVADKPEYAMVKRRLRQISLLRRMTAHKRRGGSRRAYCRYLVEIA